MFDYYLGNIKTSSVQSVISREQNMSKILEFVPVLKTEINASESHIKNVVILLYRLSNFHYDKSFEHMKRQDTLNFLQSFRKSEVKDPKHQRIGTYNSFLQILFLFFRWLYFPLVE